MTIDRELVEGELHRLGSALNQSTTDVVNEMMRRSVVSGQTLDKVVESSFEQVGEVSTVAVSRWMAGEGEDVAREVGQESWRIFGQLAAQRAAPLNEVTKRCLRWRDATAEVLRRVRRRARRRSRRSLAQALQMLQRSLDVTPRADVRVVRGRAPARRRGAQRRQEELAFLATHDALTGLPNRTLILDRVEQMLAALGSHPDAGRGAVHRSRQLQGDQRHARSRRRATSCLRAVAARLDGVIRDADALGRLGGDEFVVIADGLSLAAGPELIAERLLEALQASRSSSAAPRRPA